jgi:hypothetical protein
MAATLVLLVGLGVTAAPAADVVPLGWEVSSVSKDFAAFLDRRVSRSGKGSGSIKSVVAEPEGEGTLLQTFAVGLYRGRRVRMTGYLKTAAATSAQLWMRLDGADQTLASDTMAKRPITGTGDWVKCELVLEVPLAAINITIGALLRGTGQLWCDDVKFEIVGQGVPVTDPSGELAKPGKSDDQDAAVNRAPRFTPARSRQPRNLGFEEGG